MLAFRIFVYVPTIYSIKYIIKKTKMHILMILKHIGFTLNNV